MTSKQILIAGAALLVAAAATAYGQSREHGLFGDRGNEAAYDRGGDRDGRGEQDLRFGNRWESSSGDRWTIGDWTVDGDWENGKSRYSLTASAPPDDLHGPDLFLRCRDGKFDLTFIDEGSRWRGLYAILVMTNRSAPASAHGPTVSAFRPPSTDSSTLGPTDARRRRSFSTACVRR